MPIDADAGRSGHPTRSSRGYIVALIACACALAVLVALAGLTSLPTACGSCHAMGPYARSLDTSTHAGIHCYACHVGRGAWGLAAQKADEWFRMYPAAATGAAAVAGPGTRVERTACLRCHAKVLDDVVAPGRIRIRHARCAAGQSCDSCHGRVAHGATTRWARVYEMEECVACHRASSAPVKCDSCHTGRGQRDRLAVGAWQVTHGPAWRQTHGMGTVTYCVTCHPAGYCIRCHGSELPHPPDFGRTHGADSRAAGAKCLSCHGQPFCDGCHGIAMPHPASFLPSHAKIAKRRDDPVCLRCHTDKDCTGCHTRHIHPGRSKGDLPLPQPKAGQ